MRFEGVELVPERNIYKVDASGRIIIPSYIRNKFDIQIGDYVDYYTADVDGTWFLCCRKHELTDEDRVRLAKTGRI